MILALDRHDHRADTVVPDDGAEVVLAEGRIARVVVGPQRASAQQRLTAESLAGLDAERTVGGVARADAVADRHGVRVAFAEADHRQVAADQLLGAVGDPAQHRIEVERRGDRLRDAGEHLGLPAPALALLVQPRVLERERGLMRERLHELDLPDRKRPDVVAIGDERAEHPLADEERDGQHGPVALGLDGGARRLGEIERRIVQQVGRPDRAPLGDRGGCRAVARVQRTHGRKRAGHPAARREERRGVGMIGVHQRDRGPLCAEQRAGAVDDQRQDPLELQRRGDRAAELGERLGFLSARGVVRKEPRVVNRDRGMVGEPEQDLLVAVGQDPVVPVGNREKSSTRSSILIGTAMYACRSSTRATARNSGPNRVSSR